MKQCRECSEVKPLTEFYKHPRMADGHLNKCIPCVKARVARYREQNLEAIQAYDKQRAMLDHRVKARREYASTEKGKQAKKKAIENYHKRFPLKKAAHIVTRNAVRDKRLIPKTQCESCGSDLFIEAHHDDYTKPLNVRWLCRKCHRDWHRSNEPIYE